MINGYKYRFYRDCVTSRAKAKARSNDESEGNVIAVFLDNGLYYTPSGYQYDAAVAVFNHPNSPVAGSGVSPEYLQYCCKRVSEKVARQIHPELFRYLESEN